MTDVSIEELAVFARYRRGKSSGSQARRVQRGLDLAPGCASADEILALLEDGRCRRDRSASVIAGGRSHPSPEATATWSQP